MSEIRIGLGNHGTSDGSMIDELSTVIATESQKREFCGNCDKLQPDKSCPLVGNRNQEKSIQRGWCRWASVDRRIGRMTDDGFKPGRIYTPSGQIIK